MERQRQDETEVAEAAENAVGTGAEAGEKQQKKARRRSQKDGALEMIQKELDDTTDRMMRVMAEYDNYRKRTEKERMGAVTLGTAAAVERMLPALDALERAAAAETKDAEYKKGVEMTLALFLTAAGTLGVAEIEALGKPFDPNIHSAVANDETGEYPSGTVTRVMQKGYLLNDRVIRPAVVAVSA